MQNNITPEEKLLNLIKNGKSAEKGPVKGSETVKVQDQKQEGRDEQDKELKQKVHFLVPVKAKGYGTKSFSYINRFFFIAIVLAIVYACLSYLYPYKIDTGSLEKRGASGGQEITNEIISVLRPLSYYSDTINQRQLFKIIEQPAQKPVGPPKPKISLSQLIGGYTFVGIIFGDVPQAIVEEKKSGQSYYLTEGQYLGEIKIEKIQQGRITVSYEDETSDISI